jgi:hypothetical protein
MKILENIFCFLIGILFQTILVAVFLIVLIFEGVEQKTYNFSLFKKSGSLKDEGRNSERFGEI